jgi:TRAP-type C4-dicarboxylate transport system permease small subunit
MMQTIRIVLDRVTGGLCVALLSAMIAIITWQVFSRYALNDPSTFSEESLRFLVIWLSLIGSAYVAGQNKHMSMDLLKEFLGDKSKQRLQILIQLIFIAFAVAVLIVGGMNAVTIASSQKTAVLQLPMSLIYAALPVSGVLTVVYALLNLFDAVRGGSVPEQNVDQNSVMGE